MKAKDKIMKELYESGLFSDHLPKEFSTKGFQILSTQQFINTKEKPIQYTMAKNDSPIERRVIHIPGIITCNSFTRIGNTY